MHDLDKAIGRIRSRWAAENVPIRAGATEAVIHSFQRQHGVRLPASVERFYRLMDGMEYGSMDEGFNCVWPLSEIEPVPHKLSNSRGIPDYGEIESTLPDAPSYFAFADHSIWLNVFALRLSDDVYCLAPVIGICGANWFPVAESFDKFIEMYADDPMSIL